jgi:hypothetical protein
MVPRDIIQMLNMKPGELSEWVAADESPVVPTPSNSDSTHPAEGLEGRVRGTGATTRPGHRRDGLLRSHAAGDLRSPL